MKVFDVTVGTSPERIRARFSRESFDLVLVDAALPNLTATLNLIRELDSQAPVVLVGELGRLAERGHLPGVSGYLAGDCREVFVRALRNSSHGLRRDQDFEDRLRRAEKIESLGALAGGIAHDFNNILGIIQGFNALILEGVVEKDQLKEATIAIHDATARGAALVRQLLKFACSGQDEIRPTDIHALVRDLVVMIEHTFPKTVRVSCELAAESPIIRADPGRLHQAFLNICINARDAMPEGGDMVITTRQLRPEQMAAIEPNAPRTTYVGLEFRDTGCGMDEDVLGRAFEPFFTTKEEGKGTGLGLSLVEKAARYHGGFVRLSSTKGGGTSVRIYLPIEEAQTKQAWETSNEERKSLGGGEHILLVEDEPLICRLIQKLLQDHGYRVTTAADGVLGLEAFKSGSKIDIVVSDLDLPRMDGFRMCREIRRKDPGAKLLLWSGFIDPSTRELMLGSGIADIIDKPCKGHHLLEKIRELLDAAPEREAELAGLTNPQTCT